MSKILSERAKFKLGCNDKIGFQFIPDPKMHIFFEKVQEAEFLIFLIDIAKSTINI